MGSLIRLRAGTFGPEPGGKSCIGMYGGSQTEAQYGERREGDDAMCLFGRRQMLCSKSGP